MADSRWELYSHPSDIGIRGFGPTREAAFAQAAMALTAVIVDLEKVQPSQAVDIECRETDDELLLINWLSSLLYEMDTRGMLFSRFEIKAATYADLKVEQGGDGNWVAQCIVDV